MSRWASGEKTLYFCPIRNTLISYDGLSSYFLDGLFSGKSTEFLRQELSSHLDIDPAKLDIAEQNARAFFDTGFEFPRQILEYEKNFVGWQPPENLRHKLHLNFRSHVVRFTCDSLDLVQALQESLSSYLVNNANDLLEVGSDASLYAYSDDGAYVVGDGTHRYQAKVDLDQVRTFVLGRLFNIYFRALPFEFVFHAAGVRHEQIDWLLPAESGSGKSTLVKYLADNGAYAYTDDNLLLDDSFSPMPTQLPFCVKEGVWQTLGLHPSVHEQYRRLDGRKFILDWPANGDNIPDSRAKASVVIVPKYQADTKFSVQEIDLADKVMAFTNSGYLQRDMSKSDLIPKWVDWIKEIKGYEICYSHCDEVINWMTDYATSI